MIGNKCDCERKVNLEKVNKFAEEYGLKYVETSAKLDKNIRKAISCLLIKIIESKEKEELKANNEIIKTRDIFYSLSSADVDSNLHIVPNENRRTKKKKCVC